MSTTKTRWKATYSEPNTPRAMLSAVCAASVTLVDEVDCVVHAVLLPVLLVVSANEVSG